MGNFTFDTLRWHSESAGWLLSGCSSGLWGTSEGGGVTWMKLRVYGGMAKQCSAIVFIQWLRVLKRHNVNSSLTVLLWLYVILCHTLKQMSSCYKVCACHMPVNQHSSNKNNVKYVLEHNILENIPLWHDMGHSYLTNTYTRFGTRPWVKFKVTKFLSTTGQYRESNTTHQLHQQHFYRQL